MKDDIGTTAAEIVATMERVQEYAGAASGAPGGLPLMNNNELFRTVLRLARCVRDLEMRVADMEAQR